MKNIAIPEPLDFKEVYQHYTGDPDKPREGRNLRRKKNRKDKYGRKRG